MKENKVLTLAIYLVFVLTVFVGSLYVCNSLKVEEMPEDYEKMLSTAGTYEYQSTIFNVPVSKVTFKVYGENNWEATAKHFPTLFVFPAVMTVIVCAIVFVIGRGIKKLSKKIEI